MQCVTAKLTGDAFPSTSSSSAFCFTVSITSTDSGAPYAPASTFVNNEVAIKPQGSTSETLTFLGGPANVEASWAEDFLFAENDVRAVANQLVVADDADTGLGGTLSYAIEYQNDADFIFDTMVTLRNAGRPLVGGNSSYKGAGQLSLRDSKYLDFERDNGRVVVIIVRDGSGNVGSARIRVDVTDGNDAPCQNSHTVDDVWYAHESEDRVIGSCRPRRAATYETALPGSDVLWSVGSRCSGCGEDGNDDTCWCDEDLNGMPNMNSEGAEVSIIPPTGLRELKWFSVQSNVFRLRGDVIFQVGAGAWIMRNLTMSNFR